MLSMVKSGELDEWTDADELESMVGRAKGLNRHTARDAISIVIRLQNESSVFPRSAIEVNETNVIVHPAPNQRDLMLAELERLGIADKVSIA